MTAPAPGLVILLRHVLRNCGWELELESQGVLPLRQGGVFGAPAAALRVETLPDSECDRDVPWWVWAGGPRDGEPIAPVHQGADAARVIASTLAEHAPAGTP